MNKSDILELCLGQVLSGQASIDSVLARYPDYADELRSELDAALWLQDQRSLMEMRPGYLAASRKRLVAQISQPVPAKKPLLPWWKGTAFRLAFLALFLFVSVFSAWGGVQAVSAALPGDILHQFKLAAEDIQLSMAADPAAQAALRIQFADTRAREIETLFELGRYEDLELAFEGYRINLTIAGDLIANLNTAPEREIALMQELEHKVTNHNQVFSAALAGAAGTSMPANIVDTIRITIASNDEIKLLMVGLLDDHGAAPLPISPVTLTATVTPSLSLTPLSTLTPSPSDTSEPVYLVEPSYPSTPVDSSDDSSGDVSTDGQDKDKDEDPADKDDDPADTDKGPPDRGEDPDDDDQGIGNDDKEDKDKDKDKDPDDKDKDKGNDKK